MRRTRDAGRKNEPTLIDATARERASVSFFAPGFHDAAWWPAQLGAPDSTGAQNARPMVPVLACSPCLTTCSPSRDGVMGEIVNLRQVPQTPAAGAPRGRGGGQSAPLRPHRGRKADRRAETGRRERAQDGARLVPRTEGELRCLEIDIHLSRAARSSRSLRNSVGRHHRRGGDAYQGSARGGDDPDPRCAPPQQGQGRGAVQRPVERDHRRRIRRRSELRDQTKS